MKYFKNVPFGRGLLQSKVWRGKVITRGNDANSDASLHSSNDEKKESIKNPESVDDFTPIEFDNPKCALVKYEVMPVAAASVKSDDREDDDRKIEELMIVYTVGRIIRIIADLSSELEIVSTKLNRARDANESRKIEIDRLNAMIRVSSGDDADFRNRIVELKNFVRQMNRETRMLRMGNDNGNSIETESFYNEDRVKSLKFLMDELRMKLKNDREALLTDGDRWRSMYLRKIRELEIIVETLLLQIEKIGSDIRVETTGETVISSLEHQKGVRTLEELLRRVARDLKDLETLPIKQARRIGSESSSGYFGRVRALEKLVASSSTIIDRLIVDFRGTSGETAMKTTMGHLVTSARFKESIATLEILAEKLKIGIVRLENVFAAGDGADLPEKIRNLETSLRRMKSEIGRRDEEKSSLCLELTGARIAFDEKSSELERLQRKYEKVSNRVKKLGHAWDYEEREKCLVRQLDESRMTVKKLGDENDRLITEVTSLRAERARLGNEMNDLRAIADARNDEIVNITKEMRSKERALTRDTMEKETKLESAESAIETLKKEITDLKEEIRMKDGATRELKSLKLSFKRIKENLDRKNEKFVNLESKFNDLTIEKSKIETALSSVTETNEALLIRVNSAKTENSRALKDYEKLAADYRSLNDDNANLRTERTNLRENLEITEREKIDLRTEIEEYRCKNGAHEAESSTLKLQLKDLTRELAETREKHHMIEKNFEGLKNESKDWSSRVESLMKENDALSDELDRARSDKLNIAGSLNEVNYKYESTRKFLDEKIVETRKIEEKLSATLDELEKLRILEASDKAEIAKWRETSEKLRETINRSNLEKTGLEKRLQTVENDFQALEVKFARLNAEKMALDDESCVLNRRIAELTEEISTLRSTDEKETREREKLRTEQTTTIGKLRERVNVLEIERENFMTEIARITGENASLKSDYSAIVCENSKPRTRVKKSEIKGLFRGNEALRIDLSKLMIFVDEADREKARKKIEKMCADLVPTRGEMNPKKSRNVRINEDKLSKDSAKLEELVSAEKSVNETLRKSLEIARNKAAIDELTIEDLKTERALLKASIEGLKERYRMSRREIDDLREMNQRLGEESCDTRERLETARLEMSALEQEVKNSRDAANLANAETAQTRKIRAEMEIELAALKDELARSRSINADLSKNIEENNDLRMKYDRLLENESTLESKLIDAHKEIGKYVNATTKLNDLENKLKIVLKNYIVTRKLLKSANKEIDLLRNFANSRFTIGNYANNIEAT